MAVTKYNTKDFPKNLIWDGYPIDYWTLFSAVISVGIKQKRKQTNERQLFDERENGTSKNTNAD